jgi:hypothetical protein
MGLIAAVVGAGSGAVVAGFSSMAVDPDHFNLQNPQKLFTNMLVMFLFSGAIAFFAKLHTNPLPTLITTTTETKQLQKSPPAVVTTTVTEVKEAAPEKSVKEG